MAKVAALIEFNGHTNYPTFAVANYLTNDSTAYNEALERLEVITAKVNDPDRTLRLFTLFVNTRVLNEQGRNYSPELRADLRDFAKDNGAKTWRWCLSRIDYADVLDTLAEGLADGAGPQAA